jgi:hypothetical protein
MALAKWVEKQRNGDITINEVKEDCFLSVLVFNKEAKECVLIAGPAVYETPSEEDIRWYFDNPDDILKVLKDVGIDLTGIRRTKHKSNILLPN